MLRPSEDKIFYLLLATSKIVGLFFYLEVTQADENPIFSLEDPGGAEWVSYDQIIIPERIQLNNDTRIRVHKLVINAPIVTAGYRLHLDVQKLVFGPQGKIIAFDDPIATATQASPFVANPGPQGGRGGDAGRGGEGGAGGQGEKGEDYHREQVSGHPSPGEIVVFATEVEGIPVVIGRGQNGAKGGKGGKGGTGGTGGRGGRAKARAWKHNIHAGKGGTGGVGGTGGEGGKGGTGGKAVAVSFLYGLLDKNSAGKVELISYPGDGGSPGNGGEGGDAGTGGPGGFGDSGTRLGVIDNDVGPGPVGQDGSVGKTGPEGEKGQIGFPAPGSEEFKKILTLKDLGDLERFRKVVFERWYQFHQIRSLLFLAQESLRIIIHTQASDHQDLKDTHEIVFDTSDAKELRNLLDNVNKEENSKHLYRVIQSWKNYFILPLSEKIEKLGNASSNGQFSEKHATLVSYHRLGNQILDLLEQIQKKSDLSKTQSDLENLRNNIKIVLKTNLKNALAICSEYTENKILLQKHTTDFLGATAHFSIPVCNRDPDFRKRENLFAHIILTRPAGTQIDGLNLDRWKQTFEPQTVAFNPMNQVKEVTHDLFSILQSILLPMSHADEDQAYYPVVLVDGRKLDLTIVARGKPTFRTIHPKAGILVSYRLPPVEDINLSTISFHLRALVEMIE